MVTWAFVALFGAIAALLAAVAWLYVRLAAPSDSPEQWIACVDEDLTHKYRPMVRLLNEEDFIFLRGEPGYRPDIEKRLRRGRARIYARYLQLLNKDFARLCRAGRALAVYATSDRTDFIEELARRQFAFRVRMVEARWRLLVYRCGFPARNSSELLQVIEGLQQQVRVLTLPSPSMA
jgi:hypothetical protein